MSDTKENLEREITALEADAEQAIIASKKELNRLRARLADLARRLAKFEPSKQ